MKIYEKALLTKIMLSHLESVDVSEIHNHIPIDHIKGLNIYNYNFHCFLKKFAIFTCFME